MGLGRSRNSCEPILQTGGEPGSRSGNRSLTYQILVLLLQLEKGLFRRPQGYTLELGGGCPE